jgi:plastocyanin
MKETKRVLAFIVMVTLVSTAIAGILVLTSGSGILPLSNNSNQVQAQQQQQQANNPIRVAAGGGNATSMLAAFVPQHVQISAGQSVTWDNPSPVAEPHTVTFVFNNKTIIAPDVPFAVPSSTQFMPLPPGANSQPNMAPGPNGTNIVIVSNARSYFPTLIDSNGNAKVLGPNGNFTITGNEQYVNSGWLLPKEHQELYPNSSNTFTVNFQKVGTYGYFCAIHPWMVGRVIVK